MSDRRGTIHTRNRPARSVPTIVHVGESSVPAALRVLLDEIRANPDQAAEITERALKKAELR